MLLSRKDERRLNWAQVMKDLHKLGFHLRGWVHSFRVDNVMTAAVVFALLGVAALWFMTGCSRKADAMLTGQTLSAAQASIQLPGYKLDGSYAVVRKAWLLSAVNEWRGWYFKEVGGYDAKSDCEDFALDFIAWSKRRYKADTWHSYIPGQGPALGLYCYQQSTNTAHAIVAAITEEGLTLIEPQTGQEVQAPRPFYTIL